MSVNYVVNATALNRLQVALGSSAITPTTGQSVDAAGNYGQLVIGTSSLSGATGVLATITLQNPSFSYSGRTATLLGVTLSATASATGTAALAEVRDKNGTTIINGLTVGLSSTDFIIDNTAVVSGNTTNITAGTITG
jgi:hypothetical protein